ncbi:agenet domain-containing protein [Tanacetum coccineum]
MHQTPPPPHPRTILSWLIDNSVLLPRSKVQYRCRKDGHTMKEGRVTRDGIKCSCCQTVFSISKFESHAGSGNRRPSANIFLEDGGSLLDCQLQLKSDKIQDYARTDLADQRGLEKTYNDNDYFVTVCHYGGELVLCDQCPSSFHTHCLGITDVPDGDWFCPSCCCRVCNQNKFSDACEEETDCNVLNCEQCERRYHIGCLKRKEGFTKLESYPQVNWIYGEKVAELPLVGTRFRFRRRGMCHALVDELEKMLVGLGVERLVLPAVPECANSWDFIGFGSLVNGSDLEKLNFLGYTFLDFQGTHMCQKSLMTAPPSPESSISRDNNFEAVNGSNVLDLDHISAVSELSQVERVEESGLAHQRPLDTDQGKENDNRSASAQLEILAKQPPHVECQSEISVECSMEASNVKEEENNGRNGHIKCYQRRKTVSCGS